MVIKTRLFSVSSKSEDDFLKMAPSGELLKLGRKK